MIYDLKCLACLNLMMGGLQVCFVRLKKVLTDVKYGTEDRIIGSAVIVVLLSRSTPSFASAIKENYLSKR